MTRVRVRTCSQRGYFKLQIPTSLLGLPCSMTSRNKAQQQQRKRPTHRWMQRKTAKNNTWNADTHFHLTDDDVPQTAPRPLGVLAEHKRGHTAQTRDNASRGRTNPIFASVHSKPCEGWAEIFFPTPMPKPPGGPEGPTHPPPTTFEKTLFSILSPKLKYVAPKFKDTATKFKYIAPKLKYVAPKFKCLTQIQILEFCTTKNLPLCTRKTPGAAGLTPTQPPIGAS